MDVGVVMVESYHRHYGSASTHRVLRATAIDMRIVAAAAVAVIALAAGCPGRPGARDAGSIPDDAGALDDAGPSNDAGTFDAGTDDDAGTFDAGTDAGVSDAGESDAGVVVDAGVRTHGLESRVTNTTCFLNGAPPSTIVPVDTALAFNALTAIDALAIVAAPANKLAIVGASGTVRAFSAAGDGSDAHVVLDVTTLVRAHGLRGAAFRPDGAALIATYLPVDDPPRLVVSRFDVDANAVADVSSEEILVSIPLTDPTRAGGSVAFLFDGTLVVAVGDGGDQTAASDAQSLVGKALRIDVDTPALSGYAIPADNPFVGDVTTLPEIFALDFGNPTSCSVDRITGRLWCADAFDGTKDHVDLVSAGAIIRATLSFNRSACGVVVGPVSRDGSLPDIEGAVTFGDACSSTISALRFDGHVVQSHDAIATLTSSGAIAFGEDSEGHAYVVDALGALHQIVRPQSAPPSFPSTLSATGCFTDVVTRTSAASLIPYEVRAPLWSDGADKGRFFVMPDGTSTIDFTTTGSWNFPVGTIFIKEFAIDDDNDPSTPERIMETRFLVKRTATIFEGYSYMWSRDQTDAFLIDGAEIETYAMQNGAVDASGSSTHRHTFPDRLQCLQCHNPAAGRVLGLQTGRMNTDHDYDGFVDNQLASMDFIGLFSQPLPSTPNTLPRFPDPYDASVDGESRARSWLYANCAHCHQPGGPTPVTLDFRFETAFADMHACNVIPKVAIAELPNALIIDPGHSDNSEMFFRLSRRDKRQMPPLATLIVDPVGVDVMQQWIDSLNGCP